MTTNASRIFLTKWSDKAKEPKVSKLKTRGTVKSNILIYIYIYIYIYIIYIITSFINSETTASLHLTSFTEDVTNLSFHMPIWKMFSKFPIFPIFSIFQFEYFVICLFVWYLTVFCNRFVFECFVLNMRTY